MRRASRSSSRRGLTAGAHPTRRPVAAPEKERHAVPRDSRTLASFLTLALAASPALPHDRLRRPRREPADRGSRQRRGRALLQRLQRLPRRRPTDFELRARPSTTSSRTSAAAAAGRAGRTRRRPTPARPVRRISTARSPAPARAAARPTASRYTGGAERRRRHRTHHFARARCHWSAPRSPTPPRPRSRCTTATPSPRNSAAQAATIRTASTADDHRPRRDSALPIRAASSSALADYRFADNALDYIVDGLDASSISPASAAVPRSSSSSTRATRPCGFLNTPAYFALDDLVFVPEPGSAGLLALGLGPRVSGRGRARS